MKFEGNPTISENAIEKCSNEIFEVLHACNSPKDAALVFYTSYIKFIHSAFPPELKVAAKEAVDNMAKAVKAQLDMGWN